jgi:hypothetical protein
MNMSDAVFMDKCYDYDYCVFVFVFGLGDLSIYSWLVWILMYRLVWKQLVLDASAETIKV